MGIGERYEFEKWGRITPERDPWDLNKPDTWPQCERCGERMHPFQQHWCQEMIERSAT